MNSQSSMPQTLGPGAFNPFNNGNKNAPQGNTKQTNKPTNGNALTKLNRKPQTVLVTNTQTTTKRTPNSKSGFLDKLMSSVKTDKTKKILPPFT